MRGKQIAGFDPRVLRLQYVGIPRASGAPGRPMPLS